MKNLLVLVVVIAIVSCSKESAELKESPQPIKWELVKMTASMTGTSTTGANMTWQEHYIFVSDSTFIKRRTQGTEKIATGTYKLVKDGGQNYFELTFETGKELVASCLGQDTERLWMVSNEKMLGTWNICDGLGLEYKFVGTFTID